MNFDISFDSRVKGNIGNIIFDGERYRDIKSHVLKTCIAVKCLYLDPYFGEHGFDGLPMESHPKPPRVVNKDRAVHRG